MLSREGGAGGGQKKKMGDGTNWTQKNHILKLCGNSSHDGCALSDGEKRISTIKRLRDNYLTSGSQHSGGKQVLV